MKGKTFGWGAIGVSRVLEGGNTLCNMVTEAVVIMNPPFSRSQGVVTFIRGGVYLPSPGGTLSCDRLT